MQQRQVIRTLLLCIACVWLSFILVLIFLLLDNAASSSSLGALSATEFLNAQKEALLTSTLSYFPYELYADHSSTASVVEPVPISADAMALREEFGQMQMCNYPRTWYLCENNPTCIANDTCTHHNEPVQFNQMHTAPLRFFAQAETRRATLRNILQRMEEKMGPNKAGKRVLLLTLNSGFGFLFGNWYCSLLANGVDVNEIKKETMVLARDKDAFDYVTALGFFAPTLEEIDILQEWSGVRKIAKYAAPVFGQGYHSSINLFVKFGMPLDLLVLGYTVYVQDVDFVWHRNPLDDMRSRCQAAACDGIFITEGRYFYNGAGGKLFSPYLSAQSKLKFMDHIGDEGLKLHRGGVESTIVEANTGLFMFAPSPRTLHFFQVLLQGIFLQKWKRRDQMYYNTVMYHEHFAHMRWEILPEDLYVPGKNLHARSLKNTPLARDNIFAMHVSDTGSFQDKIRRLHDIDEWYFHEKAACAAPVRACKRIATCWTSLKTCQDCHD